MGDERAEAYLRSVAESALRRAGDELRRIDAEADPGMDPFGAASRAQWKVLKTGRILAAANALDQDFLDRFAADFHVAVYVRSRFLLNWDRSRGMLSRSLAEPPGPPRPPPPAPVPMTVTPIGRTLPVISDRAPSVLHFLAAVRTPAEAALTVAMSMHLPADGSSADVELSGAGPHHLPHGQLSAQDEHGTRYAVRFESEAARSAVIWRGIARLSPAPPATVRRLHLVGDGRRLIELPLVSRLGAAPALAGAAGISPGERLLMLEAERILATRETRGPMEGPDPAEIMTVLRKAGAIAVDSPLPGQLTALGRRLGADWPGGPVPSAAEIPASWASVLAGYAASGPASAPGTFAPLALVLPDVDGGRFALAGLSSAAGESHLHVIGSGSLPGPADRYAHNWTPGFSWWLRDSAGHWHVAAPEEPWSFGDGLQAFHLRLTPPLAATPSRRAEIVVTGPANQVRAVVPIGLPLGGR